MAGIRSAVAVLVLALAACGGSSEPVAPGKTGTTGTTGGTGATGPTGGTPAPTATNQVNVVDGSFSPGAIVVTAGTAVVWTWTTPSTHNVTFNITSLGGSGDLSGNGTQYQKTLSTAGTFFYQCTLHAGMTGSVKVE